MDGREIIVGVTGGIAAFKTAAMVSQLVQAGVGVTFVMTQSAQEFVGKTTFEALTGRKVVEHLFGEGEFPLGAHIQLAQRAQLLCVAPCTANFLAKAAHGVSDDLLSTLYLCFTGPVLLAPAMNCEMWDKPAVQRNVAQLRADKVHMVDPEAGWLSCRTVGVGRMASPEAISQRIFELLDRSTAREV
ncbi:MAG: flavoprotein [Planctomycetota bacterium]|nr:flavoprotein [Planctomycetota bacterium]